MEAYLDNSATTRVYPEVQELVVRLMDQEFGNPSSLHLKGVEAEKEQKKAAERIAATLKAEPKQLIFTSGGTESNNLALIGSALAMRRKGKHLISTAVEHASVKAPLVFLEEEGFEITWLPTDNRGRVNLDELKAAIRPDTILVSMMAVNNETGCVQPVREIAEMIAEQSKGKKKPHFHVDCVQAAGKIPLDIASSKIDSAAFSAHKICGPRGIGLLYLAEPQKFKAFLTGGGQEKGVRSGTENLFGAVAFSKVLQKYFIDKKKPDSESFKGYERQIELTKKFIDSISSLKNCRIVPETRGKDGAGHFSPYVVQAAFLGIPGNVMVRALDAKGFAISTGSACSAKKQSRPILDAMKASREVQDSAVRFSFGPLTSEKGMEDLAEAVKEVCGDFN